MVTVPRPEAPERPEQSRARYPDDTGYVARADGSRVWYEVAGRGDPPILFVPTWSIVHSRIWKAQVPYFARHRRVITFDGMGNGRSDRPPAPEAFAEREMAADILRVMDAMGTAEAVLVSLSLGAQRSLIVAAEHPERVAGMAFIGPAVPLGSRVPGRDVPFEEPLGVDEDWTRYNAHSWRRDYDGFLQFFFGQCFSEAHSTKQIEDAVGWGHDTDPETLIATERAPGLGADETLALGARVRCPVLVIQGIDDAITGRSRGITLAEAIEGARLELVEGGGHIQNARDPVRTNLLIRDFIASIARDEP
jgi:pimeloyl-ACP methyl ester carboxylesterase